MCTALRITTCEGSPWRLLSQPLRAPWPGPPWAWMDSYSPQLASPLSTPPGTSPRPRSRGLRYTLTPSTSRPVSTGSAHLRNNTRREVTEGCPRRPDVTHTARLGRATLTRSRAAAASEAGIRNGHAPMLIGAHCHVLTAGADVTTPLGVHRGCQQAPTRDTGRCPQPTPRGARR